MGESGVGGTGEAEVVMIVTVGMAMVSGLTGSSDLERLKKFKIYSLVLLNC